MTNTEMDKRAKLRRRRIRKTKPVLCVLFILIAVAMTCCVAGVLYVVSLSEDLPQITEEDFIYAQTSYVYDDAGALVAELAGAEDRTVMELSEMPQHLIDALLFTEDRRFYEHEGVDPRSLARAMWVNLKASWAAKELIFTQGASTVTMQLVSCVLQTTTDTGLVDKIKEMMVAAELEKQLDKDQILYYYLNIVYMGPGIYGMQSASQYYFGKDVSDITLEESALLVGLIRNPSQYSPYEDKEAARTIRNTVLNNMAEYAPDKYGISAKAAKNKSIILDESGGEDATYAHRWYIDYVISESEDILEGLGLDPTLVYTGGLHIYTNMNDALQTMMEEVYTDPANFPDSVGVALVESACVLMEPDTGAVVGMIGGREYTATRGFNRATGLLRSPGSSIKPLVTYGPAVESGYGSGTMLDDAPTATGWPKNDDYAYLGRISMRQAVVRSRNVCAVKMFNTIGTATGYFYGQLMGLEMDESDQINSALTLGGMLYGVSPMKMAGAFSTFANGGIYTKPRTVSQIRDSEGRVIYSGEPERTEVFSAATAYIVTSMLTSAVTGGTGTNAYISGWQVAGKTGTNSTPTGKEDPDYAGVNGVKDAWFCGYTTCLSLSVWMGYDNKWDNAEDEENRVLQYMTGVYGGRYPARLFNTIMTRALEYYPDAPHNFTAPSGISYVSVDTKSGMLPSSLTPSEFISTEMYVSGYGPSGVSDIWEEHNICLDSGKLARSGCFNVESRVLMKVDPENPPSDKVKDYALYAPSGYCEIHGGGTEWSPIGIFEGYAMSAPYDITCSYDGSGVSVSWNSAYIAESVIYVVERTRNNEATDRYMVTDMSYYDSDVQEDNSYTYRVYTYDALTGEISGWSPTVSAEL